MHIEQLGPYRIGRKLGRGGMGTVYEGTLSESGEPAAVKMLSGTLAHDEGFRERFKSEIETLRKLRHPNIVRLFGYGEQGEHLFYAMELVHGRSLEDELQAARRFTWREVTDYAIQTCRALKHAHDRGVIHRDIKPANLLLTLEGQVKLSDFGIAKLFGATGMTAVGGVLGTAEFMAPEQTDGRPITPRCDLYSLGGVMYTMLAGRPPFKAATLLEMLQLQRYAEPDPVRRYAPDVPEELQFIISDLLIKDPETRIATAMVLSRRLEAMRHGLSMRIDPLLTAPTQFVAPPVPPVSMSSVTMPAPLVPPPDPLPASEYELEPAVSPHELTAAARHERALSVTADLASATALIGGTPGVAGAPQQAAPPAATPKEPAAQPARFIKVSEEEHRRRETPREETARWRALQTALLALAVAGLAFGSWYLLQPASADTLYERITAVPDPGDVLSLHAAQADIDTFLKHYADDPRADAVRLQQETLELVRASRRAEARARSVDAYKTATPVERTYLEAMNYAKLDPEAAIERLAAIVALYEGEEKLPTTDREAVNLARQQLEDLRAQLKARGIANAALLAARLDAADQLQPTNPAAARALREAVVKLYADKPWASAAVARAQAALADLTAADTTPNP